MASKRRRRRHRSRPARGEVRAALAGGASAHTGIANAHTTGASAHNATCAFEGATVPAAVALLWEAATCADPTPARVYLERCGRSPGGVTRRIQSGEPEPTETYGGKGMTDELRALADEWARELIDERGLDLLDIERFGAVLVDRARNRIQSGTGEGAGDAGSKRKGRVRR